MPFKSRAQQRFMFAAEARGDMPEGTAERWAKHTPSIKALPARASKSKRTGTKRGPPKGIRRTYDNSMG